MVEKQPENIEAAPKLEWGPEFGGMSWDEVKTKITELNTNLTEGEKAWRLPTSNELLSKFKKIGPTKVSGALGNFHWSSDVGSEDGFVVDVDMYSGEVTECDRDYSENCTLLVRDVA